MIRRYGETVQTQEVYQRRPGAYAILYREGQILTTVQFGAETEVQLPGGGIDPGEDPLPALHREVLEETGWRISVSRKLGVFRRFTFMPEYGIWAEKLCHIYLGRPTLRMGDPSEPEHVPLWMTPEDAAIELANEGDRAFLSAWWRAEKVVAR